MYLADPQQRGGSGRHEASRLTILLRSGCLWRLQLSLCHQCRSNQCLLSTTAV